jgi:hypothetical protein
VSVVPVTRVSLEYLKQNDLFRKLLLFVIKIKCMEPKEGEKTSKCI